MTPEDVRDVTFSRALLSKNSYDEAAVDAFLDRIEATLRGEDTLTPDDVRAAYFPHPGVGRRGYTKDEVDEFLDKVMAALDAR
ncbi:DivIVA domain-containing protein [Kutzneria sp. CA-103260]|uniref:DivIVA domain-containing protein n=1 Tax=Kutzneria sp. CA-103260 TaxID=2802641 RepID=UPI001BA8CD9B|nr:DivIVA domain-containing protein [Kutzneria sp. CA-103260]QUQ69225.1 Cell cycle protein GpsB [Kutzneria sp. CA-103260]